MEPVLRVETCIVCVCVCSWKESKLVFSSLWQNTREKQVKKREAHRLRRFRLWLVASFGSGAPWGPDETITRNKVIHLCASGKQRERRQDREGPSDKIWYPPTCPKPIGCCHLLPLQMLSESCLDACFIKTTRSQLSQFSNRDQLSHMEPATCNIPGTVLPVLLGNGTLSHGRAGRLHVWGWWSHVCMPSYQEVSKDNISRKQEGRSFQLLFPDAWSTHVQGITWTGRWLCRQRSHWI